MGNNNRLAALRRFAGLQVVVVIDLLFVFCSRASSRRRQQGQGRGEGLYRLRALHRRHSTSAF